MGDPPLGTGWVPVRCDAVQRIAVRSSAQLRVLSGGQTVWTQCVGSGEPRAELSGEVSDAERLEKGPAFDALAQRPDRCTGRERRLADLPA